MAFNTSSNNNTNAPSDESWKAQAFINIYLPTADGSGRRKIGAIPLKEAKNYEAALIKRLSEDPDALRKMVNMLEFDFQLANVAVTAADLPF